MIAEIKRMLPFPLVYHEEYDLNLGDHVFPSRKYKWLHDRLLRTRFAAPEDFVAPQPASVADLLLAHDADWVIKLKNGTLTYQDILRLEIPYSRRMVEAFWLAGRRHHAGGATGPRSGRRLQPRRRIPPRLPATRRGLLRASTISPWPFAALQRDGAIQRAMVVDCDVHHGNGTAAIFAGDLSVFTLSIHQFNNYPTEKPPSSLDIHLADGVGDAEYLHRLGNGYRAALAMFKPELLIYVAGADPYYEDQLGRPLAHLRWPAGARPPGDLGRPCTAAFRWPSCWPAGYAQSVEDTITIHANTAAMAKEVLQKTGWPKVAVGGPPSPSQGGAGGSPAPGC